MTGGTLASGGRRAGFDFHVYPVRCRVHRLAAKGPEARPVLFRVDEANLRWFKMTRTALLCVVVGRYTIFWDRFYDSARAHLLKDHIKDFFVFTDQPDFFAPYVADDPHIHVQAIANEGWPNVVLNCHHYFLLQEKALSQCDYLLFFNINLIFNTDIGDEILPHGPR